MKVIYSLDPLPDEVEKSMFLIGPTPRIKGVQSWRIPGALSILEEEGYDGHVFIPEYPDGPRDDEQFMRKAQIDWENESLAMADLNLAWVPRRLDVMPAFTTNVEFGDWMKSGKLFFGAPLDAPKNDYLRAKATQYGVPHFTDLRTMVKAAIEYLGKGARRVGGERKIPLYIWRTEAFQEWYRALKNAGNRLDDAEVLFAHRSGPDKSFVFSWIIKTKIFIGAENRYKSNEYVISRTDISSVLLWHRRPKILDSEVVLIKEFRSPGRTPDGFIHELPGGSTLEQGVSKLDLAAEEVHEETGVHFEPSRFHLHGSRQLAGTFSSHHAHLFSIPLTQREFEWYCKAAVNGQTFGMQFSDGCEKTYIEIKTIRQIIEEHLVDWSTLGMIFQAVSEN